MIFVRLISLETGSGFICHLPVPCLETSVSLCHVRKAAVKKQQQLCEALVGIILYTFRLALGGRHGKKKGVGRNHLVPVLPNQHRTFISFDTFCLEVREVGRGAHVGI